MNEERFRELLADYVAGELDSENAAELRAELARDPRRRALAKELQAAAAALEADLPSLEEAEQRTATLTLPAVGRAASTKPRWLHALLRYAAVIALAFGAGFLARDWQQPRDVPPPQAAPRIEPDVVNARYAAGFARAAREFPQSELFSRSLLMLARE